MCGHGAGQESDGKPAEVYQDKGGSVVIVANGIVRQVNRDTGQTRASSLTVGELAGEGYLKIS